ncbi:MAG: penicillin-binding protein 1C, partial [Bacteroidales bacterium]
MNKKLKIGIITAGVIIAPVLLSPLPRFRAPLSTIVEARDGSLLGGRIADDGQWRFPSSVKVPEKFEKALLTFEDRYFYLHPGVNPVSIARALAGNIRARRIVSGGSTITMQVARLSGGNKPRTYGEKLIEVAQAFKLEIFRTKREILRIYAGNAPFGGNTVGIDAASWRYTGKPPEELTWAEAAALAVLPNSPALVYPGRNQARLRERRNQLLRKLYERKYMDSLTLVLSLDEPLPHEPGALPSNAPHLTSMFSLSDKGKRIRTTIDADLQERATAIINDHQRDLSGNFIFNCAAIIVGVKKGDVLAYVGNSTNEGLPLHGGDVDIIRSERSTGSILKPLLYAAMQQSGELLPNSLVPDIPTRFPGFSPKNFDRSFSGAVSADLALYQSLNIPAVKMLQEFTSERFLDLLRKTGFSSFRKPADHYGLSLILGGGEASLWELTGVYASCSRVLRRYNAEKKYFKGDFHPPLVVAKDTSAQASDEDPDPPLSAAAIWLTYEALQKVNRPESETGWQYFASAPGFAWKTGTSFGFRDAWAIGTTPEYVIGVWAGNADGEGRPGLTGISAAAPLLFDLAGLLKPAGWFEQPVDEMTVIKVCKPSGFRAGPDCPDTREVYACIDGLRSEPCPYHRVVHLNGSRTRQVSAACA